MPKFPEGYHLGPCGCYMGYLPLMKPIFQVIHHGHFVGRRIQKDDSQASRYMHHAKTYHYIRSRAVSDANDIFDSQLVQNGHQVLA